jgi:2-phosphoglycerate kinase
LLYRRGVGEVAVVLIGGTSHVGKSTVAAALADVLGWRYVSTDRLARHPGRPWTTDRPHVREHYATLAVAELTAAQLAHYERMWPLVEELVRDALAPGRAGLVLEGSGIWPDRVLGLLADRVAAVWLTSDDRTLRDRVTRTSRLDERTPAERRAIEKFLGRTLGYQARMVTEVDRLGLTRIAVDDGTPVAEVVDRIRQLSGTSNG